MHNHFHVHINRNQFSCIHCLVSEYSRIVRGFFRKNVIRELVQKVREATIYCLTTLAVSGLFLSGIYFFLVQLAQHGW